MTGGKWERVAVGTVYWNLRLTDLRRATVKRAGDGYAWAVRVREPGQFQVWTRELEGFAPSWQQARKAAEAALTGG